MVSFLLEVGTEELPATFVETAIQQWKQKIPASLKEQFLSVESVQVWGTPRRLAVLIEGLPSQQPDREEEIKGPPASTAFKDGKPTPAAEGFIKKQGITLEDLEIRPTSKGDFVFVLKKIPGRLTAEILAELTSEWITKLEGKRFMRWGDGDLKFPRPIRWLIALLDNQVLPVTLVSGSEVVKSDRISHGHRVLHPENISISHSKTYAESLKKAFVQVDPQERIQTIQKEVKIAANIVGGEAEIPEDLLAEVVNLVEWPTAVVGTFDQEFLDLPAEVIKTVMVTHQRYFPILTIETKNSSPLKPYFITISNGDPAKSNLIAAGNERVIRARLADGQFFYKSDLKTPLESYLPALEAVTFQEDLGSVRDKVNRIGKIANWISEQLNIIESDRSLIQRAALLCKADLVTQMVYEFPELQGIMGEKYAIEGGEPAEVARAIFEHYLPRNATDNLPQTLVGQVVGLADKLDTLVSIFGLGMLPTGSSDPFALRRAANAVVNIIWAADLPLNLYQLLKQINAVLGENDLEYQERALQDLLDVRDRALFLQTIRQDGSLNQIYETVNRSTRLAKQGDLNTLELQPEMTVNPELFQKSSERQFYQALVQLVPQTQASQATRNYRQLVEALAEITPTVSSFFDGPESVLVMDDDPNIQRNRLNLLGLLRNHARVLADFGAIVKS
ncbi:glycine--tRNA ligase subunit beta [Planktothrix agardhii]|uniref:glycine--tRNA ligase subunit beta n=1 Tax=Planktothrix agardhii TaxID=1160 RepID=UPI001F3F9B7B|nr:glycine--tRNA ligase subunit beta [Planktothrix agardhii]MCF3574758.1 glycine--tRNA ligase subunit beta [Planktothrix agardhii 1812]